VCTRGAFRKHGDVPGLQLPFTVGTAERRPTRERDQPLLAAELVVVRPGLLARRNLVEAAAEQPGSETLADRSRSVAEALPVVLVVPVLLAEEVEDLHGAILRPSRGRYSD
jgi:hypothetical protein